MKVLYINNDGGGFADKIEVDSGTTVTELFAERLPDRKAEREDGGRRAVLELSQQEREREHDQQPAEPVPTPPDQRDEPCRQERPGDDDARHRLPPGRAQPGQDPTTPTAGVPCSESAAPMRDSPRA